MTSPGTACSQLKFDSPSVASAPRPRFRQRRLADDPNLLHLMAEPAGALGRTTSTVSFAAADFHEVPARSAVTLGELVIVAGDARLVITETDDAHPRTVLTGVKGRHNDCLILFRHAYGAVTCEFGVGALGSDAHVGFLRHGDFAEVRTFSYAAPRERVSAGDAGFWTTLSFQAQQLNELQGIVWRGGTLCFGRITLAP